MSKVLMEKDGSTISVDVSTVAEHKRVGWSVKSVSNDLAGADIVIGAEDDDTINAAIQLQDANGDPLAESMSLIGFLCDDTGGLTPTGTAPDGHVAAGSEGGCIHLTTDKVFLINTNASGVADVDLVESGADTWYLVLVFPNGERIVSDAITFA
jgi:hypothetical protein